MTTSLAVFTFEGNHQVRFVGTADNPWWVAADVCKALGLEQVSRAVSRLDDDERGVTTINLGGRKQEVNTVNESGLYSLILASRKPQAKRFKKWITSEVIPSIRKTGSYSLFENVTVELMQLANHKASIQAEIQKHQQALKTLEAAYKKADKEYLELAAQFVEANSQIGELYTTCKTDLSRRVLNPYA